MEETRKNPTFGKYPSLPTGRKWPTGGGNEWPEFKEWEDHGPLNGIWPK